MGEKMQALVAVIDRLIDGAEHIEAENKTLRRIVAENEERIGGLLLMLKQRNT